MQTFLIIIICIIIGLAIIGAIKKPGSIYKDKPSEQNPMQGKRVRFVENPHEPENADGARGHLEAVGETNHHPSFYEKVVKRCLDLILSFCGLAILSPVFLLLSLWIIIDDPGPVLFTQKRLGRDKQYFKLHNIVTTEACLIHRGVTADLRHGCNEIVA